MLGFKNKRMVLQASAILFISSFMIFFQNCGGRDYGLKIPDVTNPVTDVVSNDDGLIVIDNPPEEDDQASLPGGGNNDYICDPFGGNSNGGAQSGLKARLNILKSKEELNMSQSNYDTLKSKTVLNYFNPVYSQQLTDNIYFSELNVTPRRWTDGFSGSNGQAMEFNGQVMNEWFGLEFETSLQLATVDQAGYYQIATLSDDGSLISMGEVGNNAYEVIVNNDATHSPKLGCSQKAVYIEQGQKIPTRIHYFQGPRSHIALVVLYRKVIPNGDQAPQDKECGKVGTNYFFTDPINGPSAMLAPYQQLISQRDTQASASSPNGGWKVLTSENYSLSDNQENPCVAQ